MKLKKYYTSRPIIITALLAFVSCIGVVYAINAWNQGYEVPTGATVDVTIASAAGTCQRVYNGGGVAKIFVPTKTTGEWNNFNSYKPSGVTVASCCVPYMGSSCSCQLMVYSCQPAIYTADPAWCTSPGQSLVSYVLNYSSPVSCSSQYSGLVSCSQASGGSYDCGGTCMDNYTGIACGTNNYYNGPLP